MRERPRDYGDDVRRVLEYGMLTSGTNYVRAQRSRARTLAEAKAVLADHDALLAPGSAIVAPKIDAGSMLETAGERVDLVSSILRFTQSFDATGQPVLAVPTGLSPSGLPLAMQIVGKLFDESTVMQIGASYERARGPLPPPTSI